MVLTVRVFKETEVHVADNLTEEEQNKIAVSLALQKFEMMGVNTKDFDVAILREN